MRTIKVASCVTLLALLSGCSLLNPLTGPNRLFRLVMSTNNFTTFEGVCSNTCEDVVSNIDDNAPVTGCVMSVIVMNEHTPRRVFFPRGDMYSQAQLVPLGARVSINGSLIESTGALFEAKNVEWRKQ